MDNDVDLLDDTAKHRPTFEFVRAGWHIVMTRLGVLDNASRLCIWSDSCPQHFKVFKTLAWFSEFKRRYGVSAHRACSVRGVIGPGGRGDELFRKLPKAQFLRCSHKRMLGYETQAGRHPKNASALQAHYASIRSTTALLLPEEGDTVETLNVPPPNLAFASCVVLPFPPNTACGVTYS